MITKFKIFENSNKPEVGDWVIAYDEDIYPFLKDSPGQIEKIEKDRWGRLQYYIHFYDLKFSDGTPYNAQDPVVDFGINDIKYWSKDRLDVEEHMILLKQANKYNL